MSHSKVYVRTITAEDCDKLTDEQVAALNVAIILCIDAMLRRNPVVANLACMAFNQAFGLPLLAEVVDIKGLDDDRLDIYYTHNIEDEI